MYFITQFVHGDHVDEISYPCIRDMDPITHALSKGYPNDLMPMKAHAPPKATVVFRTLFLSGR
jgi:hypothetical protein